MNDANLWRPRAIWISALLFGVCALFFNTYREMVSIWWTSSTFNHCFLIVPISLWLVHGKRAELAAVHPACTGWGILFGGINAALWLIGDIVSISAIQHAAAVGILIGAVWTLIGQRAARILWFPLWYLYFGVPEGEFLVPALQDWTATVTVSMLRFSNIPVFLEGLYLTIPTGRFHVAEACSGINYLIATLAVGVVFAYTRYKSIYRRAAFMLLAIAVPLIANGLRAYGIVMIAHLSDYKYALGIDHYIYGGVFFGLVILLLFSVGSLFSDVDEASAPEPVKNLPAGPHAARRPLLFAGAFMFIVAIPVILNSLPPTVLAPAELNIAAIDGWKKSVTSENLLDGKYNGRSQYVATSYVDSDSHTVSLEISFYRNEQQGGELINQNNRLYNKKVWTKVSEREVASAKGDVRELHLRHARGGDYLVWYWLDIADQRTISQWQAMWYRTLAKLFGDRYGSAAIELSTEIGDEPAAASDRLERFTARARLRLSRMLGDSQP